jgi:hypothetical protein
MPESETPQPQEQGIASIVTETMVLSAIQEHCAGCSAANFAPRRFGVSVARERATEEMAIAFARRLSNCPGVLSEAGVRLCRLPSAQ